MEGGRGAEEDGDEEKQMTERDERDGGRESLLCGGVGGWGDVCRAL